MPKAQILNPKTLNRTYLEFFSKGGSGLGLLHLLDSLESRARVLALRVWLRTSLSKS